MKKNKSMKIIFISLLLSFAVNETRAGTILGDGQAGMVRFLYFLINGPPASGYPSACGGPCGGPSGGFLGMIREITGPTALGGGLLAGGISTCAEIPTTGSVTMADADGTFVMSFSSPIKTVPTGYTGAGASFDKRVSVTVGGIHFMDIEFNCNTTVGWMRFADPSGISGGNLNTARHLEIYYDTTVSSAAKLELAMYYEDGSNNEYFIAKFETTSTSQYSFWLTRAATSGGNSGFRIAVRGDRTTKLANVHMTYENGTYARTQTAVTDGGDISIAGGDLQCIDYTDGANPVSSAGCGALTVSAGGTSIIDTDGNFSIENTSNTAKLKAAFSAL